jgi:type VI protein secretion system component VasK
VTALHLGPLHPFAQTMVLLLAFGPFVVLVAVVWWVRRRDVAEEAAQQDAQQDAQQAAQQDAQQAARQGERSRRDAGAGDAGTTG